MYIHDSSQICLSVLPICMSTTPLKYISYIIRLECTFPWLLSNTFIYASSWMRTSIKYISEESWKNVFQRSHGKNILQRSHGRNIFLKYVHLCFLLDVYVHDSSEIYLCMTPLQYVWLILIMYTYGSRNTFIYDSYRTCMSMTPLKYFNPWLCWICVCPWLLWICFMYDSFWAGVLIVCVQNFSETCLCIAPLEYIWQLLNVYIHDSSEIYVIFYSSRMYLSMTLLKYWCMTPLEYICPWLLWNIFVYDTTRIYMSTDMYVFNVYIHGTQISQVWYFVIFVFVIFCDICLCDICLRPIYIFDIDILWYLSLWYLSAAYIYIWYRYFVIFVFVIFVCGLYIYLI